MAEPQPPPLPTSLPVLPLRRTVAFPLTLQPLAVNRPMSIEAVNAALAGDRLLLLVLQTDRRRGADAAQLESVGHDRHRPADGASRARAEHHRRGHGPGAGRRPSAWTGTSMRADVEPLPEQLDADVEVDAYVRRIQELVDQALSLTTGASPEVRQLVAGIDDPLRLGYLLGTMLDASGRGEAGAARGRSAAQEARAGARAARRARSRCSSSRARSSRRRSRR